MIKLEECTDTSKAFRQCVPSANSSSLCSSFSWHLPFWRGKPEPPSLGIQLLKRVITSLDVARIFLMDVSKYQQIHGPQVVIQARNVIVIKLETSPEKKSEIKSSLPGLVVLSRLVSQYICICKPDVHIKLDCISRVFSCL